MDTMHEQPSGRWTERTHDGSIAGERVGTTWNTASNRWRVVDAEPSSPDGAFNIVIVVLDDCGYSHLGCYGSSILTPAMDALAHHGLQYTNFHVTPMCSPTRAALLTGRNPHSIGIASIVDWPNGFPNNRGYLAPDAGTLAEILKPHGYASYAIGKWHLASPQYDRTSGPFDKLPLGRGFDRYYGFSGPLTDQWHPNLILDNQHIVLEETGRKADYHLSDDLVEKAVTFVRDHRASTHRPYFLYVAFGACHSPHQAPRRYVDTYRGAFDHGWDEERRRVLRRQIDEEVVPPGTALPPRNVGVPPWAELPRERRALYARMQEVFAGFLTHCDHAIGRLLDSLAALGGIENTLVMVLSDNGASGEGGESGTDNILRQQNGLTVRPEELLQILDDLGTERTASNYPSGWGMVGNTPLKLWKRYTHGGGIRAPFIMRLPASVAADVGKRRQFHYVTDVVPTILDLLHISPPEIINGRVQVPIHGSSLAYSFAEPEAPTRKHQQYFEMLGHRSIWQDGWKAVCQHIPGTAPDDDVWELYHLDRDFSEFHDLSSSQPDLLASLVHAWWEEAERFDVLPLDDRGWERIADEPTRVGSVERYVYTAGTSLSTRCCPQFIGRSYRIVARMIRTSRDDDGVLLAIGGRFGGFSFYVRKDAIVHDYNYFGRHYVLTSDPRRLGTGEVTAALDFRRQGRSARVALSISDQLVAEGAVPELIPIYMGAEPMEIGRDTQTPVSDAYECPFAFKGEGLEVTVELFQDEANGASELSPSVEPSLFD